MKTRYIIATVALGACVAAQAQDLQKEITVDRTVQPELREAYRLNGITPSIISPTINRTRLQAAEYTSPGEVTAEAGELPPAPWRDSIPHTPYRGYVSAGYFPLANTGLNAGYNIVDTDRAHVGAWAQYCLSNYKGALINRPETRPLGIGALSIGADAAYRINPANDVALSLKYGHNSVKTPKDILSHEGQSSENLEKRTFRQKSNLFTADAAWRGNFETFRLKSAVGFEHFGYNDGYSSLFLLTSTPAKENIVTAAIGGGLADDAYTLPWIGIDVDWSMVNASGFDIFPIPSIDPIYPVLEHKYTLGHIKPYLRFGESEGLVGHVGFHLSVGTGNDNGKVRIAPDIDVNWIPSRAVTIYARATGGQYINSQSALFGVNPFMLNYFAYERSNIAYDIEAGAKLTAPGGFAAHVFGGVASGRDRLTPVIYYNSIHVLPFFAADNIRSWHAGARLSYTFKYIFSLAAYAEIAGSNKDFATWQYWYDGAKAVVGVDFNVKPINALDITVKYQLRTKRRVQSMTEMPDAYPTSLVALGVANLHNISDLSVNATYRITEQFTAFINLENLLNRKYFLISGMPAQGVYGLLGVAYKF